jgi:hypothetical protein
MLTNGNMCSPFDSLRPFTATNGNYFVVHMNGYAPIRIGLQCIHVGMNSDAQHSWTTLFNDITKFQNINKKSRKLTAERKTKKQKKSGNSRLRYRSKIDFWLVAKGGATRRPVFGSKFKKMVTVENWDSI